MISKDDATYALTLLLDQEGHATEWNDAIETAIKTIENLE